MAHYAEINEDNIVIQVLTTDNAWSNKETIDWLQINVSLNRWIQTSYNANFRSKYAGIGDIYNAEYDEFRSPDE